MLNRHFPEHAQYSTVFKIGGFLFVFKSHLFTAITSVGTAINCRVLLRVIISLI